MRVIIKAALLVQTDEMLIVMPMLKNRLLRGIVQVIYRVTVQAIDGI